MKEYRKLESGEYLEKGDFIVLLSEPEPMFQVPLDLIGIEVSMLHRLFDILYVGRFVNP